VVLGTIGTNIAIRIWLTIMGLPVVVLVAIALHTPISWRSLPLMLPALIVAAALRFLWTYILALLAFWTQRVHAVVGFGSYISDLLGGTIAPILFLPASFGAIARVLPFYGMYGLPADIAIGRVHGLPIVASCGYEIGWLALLVGIAIGLWRSGLRSYTAVGA
jgi:ABC-2 type transport system permease protein